MHDQKNLTDRENEVTALWVAGLTLNLLQPE